MTVSNSLTQNIYFPALNPIADELHVSVSLINLTLTTYMIFQVSLHGRSCELLKATPSFLGSTLSRVLRRQH